MNDAPPPGRNRARDNRAALAVTAVILALSFIAIGVYAWQALGASELTVHGYIALVLGVIGTAGLGVGLMVLVFYSSRHGYDERVGGRDEPPGRR